MNVKLMATLLAMAVAYAAHAETATSPAPEVKAATPAATPDTGKPPKNHGKRMDKVAQELGLNEDQKTKMKAIIEEKHQKIKAAHEAANAKLKTVLTPEQYTKFESMHPYRRHGKPE